MNQKQRDFLIERITKTCNAQLKELRESMPKKPNLSNYLLSEVAAGTFKIVDNNRIMELISEKIINAKAGENWMAYGGFSSAYKNAFSRDDRRDDDIINFLAEELFIVSDKYRAAKEKYEAEKQAIEKQMEEISLSMDGLVARIQLSSDKALDTLIVEMDNIGDLKLVDLRLKEVQQKLLK